MDTGKKTKEITELIEVNGVFVPSGVFVSKDEQKKEKLNTQRKSKKTKRVTQHRDNHLKTRQTSNDKLIEGIGDFVEGFGSVLDVANKIRKIIS